MATATGGNKTAAGANSVGGQTSSNGGSTATGGQSNPTGGALATGGNSAVGGANSGGKSSGGTNSSGGKSSGNGGATATGGKSNATGGTNAQGGTVGVGGASLGGASLGGASLGGASPGVAGKGGQAGGGGVGKGGQGGAAGQGVGGKATGGLAAGGQATGGVTASGGSGGEGGNGATGEDTGLDCVVGTLPTTMTANAKLPNPFKKLDGTVMTSKDEWHCRREEIVKLAEQFAYGTKTIPKAGTVTGSVSSSSISVKVSDNGKTASFSATVSLPTTGSAPYPAVVVLGGMGADTTTIKAAGAAVISYDPYSVGAEGTARTNKSGAYYSINGSTSTTGLLMAWGWGVSRIIDVIEQSDGKTLRADGIGVTGCSRFGKGAFIVGVFDERIALTMPIESGSAGVPIWRGIPGEGAQTLSSAYGEQPWFGDAFSAFTSDPTKAPLDTHEVVALVAPRGLFIMDNPHIANLGPKSGSVAALGGAEVYKALGATDNITYWSDIADGGHCNIRPEWKDPLTKNIQKFLLKTGTYAGSMHISSKASGKLSDWSDWTTPTLK
jgi:hypothetical protein